MKNVIKFVCSAVQVHLMQLTLCLSLVGCVRIGEREPVHQDRLIRTDEVESPTKGVFAVVKPEGTRLHLSVDRACDITRVRVVDRTTVVEHFNEESERTWLTAGAGVAGIGAGAGFILDVFETKSGAQDPSKDTNFGIALVGAGVALTTIAIIDAVRASSSTTTPEGEVTVPGSILKRSVKCEVHPVSGIEVEGNFGGEVVTLGVTDPLGYLEVDLDAVIPSYLAIERGERMSLSVSKEPAGVVDLSAVGAARSSRWFKKLDLKRCEEATAVDACDPLRGFLRDYPDAAESVEVRKSLQVGEPREVIVLDDQFWSEIQATRCGDASIVDPREIEKSCSEAAQYRKQFSSGRHVAEVTKLLDDADARIKKFYEKDERERKAEAAKEEAAEKARCHGQCKVICSSRRFADSATCFQGCVQAQCTAQQWP